MLVKVLGKRGINLIYGGGSLGLMGCVLTATAVHGRRVLGIVPSVFTEKNLIGKTCGKELKVASIHERLLKMIEFGDAFITLPDHAMEQKFITQSARQILISALTAEELIDKLQAFHSELDAATPQLKWPIGSSQK
ncbi:hypothetical protein DITRI_Ditri19aG0201500 [Diplodiscus trichospermus]